MKKRPKLFFLYLCKYLGLFRVAGYVTRNKLRILCYHGFALDDEASFRQGLFIKEQTFKRRLDAIDKYRFPVLQLDDALARLKQETLPQRAVVLTIDDGFYGVWEKAKLLLEQKNLPATVYVTSYYMEKENPVFRLAVQYMFWKTKKKTITIEKRPWAADQTVALQQKPEREAFVRSIIDYGENQCSEAQRTKIADELGHLLGVSYQAIKESRKFSIMTKKGS